MQLGTSGEKTIYVGQSLNDDIYHSVVIRRRGRNVRAIVDDDEPLVGESLTLKRFHLHVRDSHNLPAKHLEYCFYYVPEMNHIMYYRIVMSSIIIKQPRPRAPRRCSVTARCTSAGSTRGN